MQYLKLFALAISLTAIGMGPSYGWATSTVHEAPVDIQSPWAEVRDYARENLPLEGQLIVKSDGFGYLKVDDEYIHTLLPMLDLAEEGYKEPPYFRSKEAPGAHISVFYVHENVIPEEAGQYFSFELKQIVIVKPSRDISYVVLQVESPELEKLRKKIWVKPKAIWP